MSADPSSLLLSPSAWLLLGFLFLLPAFPKLKPNLGLYTIPTAGCGSQSWFAAWKGAVRFVNDGKAMVEEGYRQYPGRVFKIPTLTGWLVIGTSREHIEDIRKAREELSFTQGVADMIHTTYTIGPEAIQKNALIEIVRTPLTRHIATAYPDIRDEILAVFDEFVPPANAKDWKEVNVSELILQSACRASHRMFVGLPLCRDPDYVSMNITFTSAVFGGAAMMTAIPDPVKPFVARFLSVRTHLRRGDKFLRSLIQSRLKQRGVKSEDRPNDLITWLVDYGEGDELLIRNMVTRLLQLDLAAIHSIANAIMDVVFDLTAMPEYIQEISKEIRSVTEEEGWTKVALSKMAKLDSFIMESMRVNTPAANLIRKAMSDFTFSDGTFVPKGNILAVAAGPIHLDETYYPDPYLFDGRRFCQDDKRPLFTNPTHSWLIWGHGQHACPGRFLATTIAKTIVAHLILNYDFKFPEGQGRPETSWFGTSPVPSRSASIQMRRKSD